MKKIYNSPEIKVSEFAVENIVTGSSNTTAVDNTTAALQVKMNGKEVKAILTF